MGKQIAGSSRPGHRYFRIPANTQEPTPGTYIGTYIHTCASRPRRCVFKGITHKWTTNLFKPFAEMRHFDALMQMSVISDQRKRSEGAWLCFKTRSVCLARFFLTSFCLFSRGPSTASEARLRIPVEHRRSVWVPYKTSASSLTSVSGVL